MAAYYHNHHHHNHINNNNNNNNPVTNSEIQDHSTNNFHTLILMNPNLADPQQQQQLQSQQLTTASSQSHNILLLNSAATAAAAAAAAAATLSPPQPLLSHHHHFVRLPTSSPPEPNNITLYGYPSNEARDMPRARQGLSLSLSSQNHAIAGGSHQGGDGNMGSTGGHNSIYGSKYLKAVQELLEEVVHLGDHNSTSVIYKNNTSTTTNTNNDNDNDGSIKKYGGESPSNERDGGRGGGGGGGGGGGQLSTAERQEILMKKTKLVTMLDEAEQRYRQYNHQMQIVIESFEQGAVGSAKTYTALALKTISKQFRCLKDAIQGQIRAANKTLGDDQEGGSGSLAGGKIEGSRLKYIDHQIRQQRALQQLGMIQNPNAWRPQRGLPERSVSVLRAWLFEHFLHPYPKDSDKIMLAKQTGLTRSQVSNWFINARVRLWKPMIEEMYTEELKEQERLSEEKLGNSSKENSNNENDSGALNYLNNQEKTNIIAENHQVNNCKEQNNATASTSSFISIPSGNNTTMANQNQHGFTLSSSLDMEDAGISPRGPKRQRNDAQVLRYDESNNGEIMIKFGNEKQGRENENGYPIISGGMNFIGMGGGDLGTYPIGEIGRFETEDFSPQPRFLHGNGISLSLGLPPCENHPQQLENLSATNHTFLSPNHTFLSPSFA